MMYANIRFGLVNWNYGTQTTHTHTNPIYQNDVRVHNFNLPVVFVYRDDDVRVPWFQFTDGVRVLVSIYQTVFAYHDFNLPVVFAYCDSNLPHGSRTMVQFTDDFNLSNHICVLWFHFTEHLLICTFMVKENTFPKVSLKNKIVKIL